MERPFGKIINNRRHLPSTTEFLTEKGTTVGEKRCDGITWMHDEVVPDFT
jgi:hypothetical protein